MCTIQIGISFDISSGWAANTEVLDEPIDGLERQLFAKSDLGKLKHDVLMAPLDICKVLKASYKNFDRMLAIVMDSKHCFAIPGERLIAGWSHAGGRFADIDGQKIDIADFKILVVSRFSLPDMIDYTIGERTETIADKTEINTIVSKRKGSTKKHIMSKKNMRTLSWLTT